MRSTGHLFLHRMIRSALGPRVFIDFAFFPSKADQTALDGAGIPWLTGIDARRSAEDYDAVLVSCSYALELVNLPLLLKKSGVPLRSSERRRRDGAPYPAIILGGSNALASQALIYPDGDSFVDGIFFGEGEAGGAELVASLAATAGFSLDARMDALEAAAPAFWGSCRGEPDGPRADGQVRLVRPGRCSISGAPLLLDAYPLLNSEEASTARLQISWGCPSFCSFCFEGWERKPYRELPKKLVLETAKKLKRESGASVVDLYSFNFNAHEDALELIFELNKIFDRVNMMSQRADLLVRTGGMIACELAAEKRSFTVGVEGVSAGMRSYYSKDLSDSDLNSLMERLLKEKVRELKLFYIFSGLETEADLNEFRSFCAQLRALADDWHPGLRAIFSFGYLVRMPFTPLRAERLLLDRSAFQSIAEKAKDAVETYGFEFRLASDWNEYVADQLLVSGSYALSRGLEAATASDCAFDLRVEGDLNKHLTEALRNSGELDTGRVLSGPLVDDKKADHRYPLSFVETSASDDFRSRAFEKAKNRVDTPSCLGDNSGACLGCSACADEAERTFLTRHRVKSTPGQILPEKIIELIRSKRKAAPVFIAATLPDALAGAENEFLSALLLRDTLKNSDGLDEVLFRMEEVLRNSPEWKDRIPVAATGAAIIAAYGTEKLSPEKVAEALSKAFAKPAKVLAGFKIADIAGMDMRVEFLNAPEASLSPRVSRWLNALHLSFTERKTEGGRLFEIAPKDKKKRIIEKAEIAAARILICGGAKLDLSQLMPKAEDRAAARVVVQKLELR